MADLNLFIPITKIDQAKRLVYGVATAEAEDRAGEICDYASTKPFYEKWSGDIAKATDGKSLGNVRAMHGSVAAGKVTSINFNDEARQIEICAKVVDDAEWKKVEEGVYTGFSQGGAYVKRWQDEDGLQRYTADPHEVSLVDLPCLPSATFSVIKADGSTVQKAFKLAPNGAEPSNAVIAKRAEELAAAAGGKWPDFFDQARVELTQAASPVAKAADPVDKKPKKKPGKDKGDSSASNEDDGDGSDDENADDEEAEKVWKSRRDGSEHSSLEALRKHHEQLDADEAVSKAAGPALEALAAIAGKLGIEKKDYSDDARAKMADSGEAMPDGSFPIKTKADLENAIKAFGRAKDPDAAKKHIIERAKALGATDMLPADWPGSTAKADKAAPCGPMFKGLEACARLACLIQELEWLQQGTAWESATEADNSPLPAGLAQNIADLCATLRAMVAEETAELAQGIDIDPDQLDNSPLAAAAGTLRPGAIAALSKIADPKCVAILEKAGARNSKGDAAKIQAMHDNAVDLGATCGGSADKHAHGDFAKLEKALADATALAEARQRLIDDKMMPMLTAMSKRLDELAAQPRPLPFAAGTRAISKGQDNGGREPANAEEALAKMSDEEKKDLVFKYLLNQPRQINQI